MTGGGGFVTAAPGSSLGKSCNSCREHRLDAVDGNAAGRESQAALQDMIE